jgi:hypothetical protein
VTPSFIFSTANSRAIERQADSSGIYQNGSTRADADTSGDRDLDKQNIWGERSFSTTATEMAVTLLGSQTISRPPQVRRNRAESRQRGHSMANGIRRMSQVQQFSNYVAGRKIALVFNEPVTVKASLA